MEGKVGKQCRIRKRGCSSSSSSSLVRKYRFKRAILVGKRAGSSTPVPTWKTSRRSPSLAMTNSEFPVSLPLFGAGKGKELSVSARKLAATLWEINEFPSPQGKRELDMMKDGKEWRNKEMVTKLLKFGPRPLQLSDSSYSHVSEIENGSRGKAHTSCTVGIKTRLKDVSNGLATSKELLKVLYRVSGFDQHHSSSISLVSALRVELDRVRIQVKHMIQEQQSDCNEIEHLVEKFAEEKTAWKSRERERIRDAIARIAEELVAERKFRRQTARLNKKLGKELADTKASLSKTLKELESEKRAKEILEQVCDELVRGIGDDRAQVEQLKRESEKVLEEVEKEREMLQLADVLREERVQMKLAEAKYHFEEKSAAVEQLRRELESYLKNKMCKENGDGTLNSGRIAEVESPLRKNDFKLCLDADNEVRESTAIASPKSERTRELEAFLRRNHLGLCQSAERKNAEAVDEEHDGDDDSADSDLHSIELNMDTNSKSYKWSYARGNTTGNDPNRFSVDKIINGRKSNAKKFQWENTIFATESSFGIGWDFDLRTEDIEGDIQRERSTELVSRSQSPENEDKMKDYRPVKYLKDEILSASKFPSVESFATPNRQWGLSLPLQNSSSGEWEKCNTDGGE